MVMKEIPLTQNKTALVDDSDYDLVKHHKWFAVFDGYNWYAARKLNGKQVRMQNFLMNPPKGVVIDHKDRNGLNNQRANLRICLHRENMRNMFKKKLNKSGFKGVCWKSANRKWVAQINAGRVIHLGLFSDPKHAAMAYDRAAEKFYGEFALTNKMLGLLK